MATVKFSGKKNDAATGPASEAQETPVPQQAAPAPQNQVATRPDATVGQPIAGQDDMAGAWNRGDVRLPRINLIHKTSKGVLVEKFGIGGFAFDQLIKLSDGTTPISITALRMAKDYAQKLPFGSPEKPAIFDTPEQVIAAGGSLNYRDNANGNYFQPRAHIQLVVEQPEGLTDVEEASLFPYEFGGKNYGMGMFTVSSSAYTSVGIELATLRSRNNAMRKGLLYGRLALTSETRQDKQRDWKVPVVKFVSETTAEMAEFFVGLLNS
jgi:hypothetical protein